MSLRRESHTVNGQRIVRYAIGTASVDVRAEDDRLWGVVLRAWGEPLLNLADSWSLRNRPDMAAAYREGLESVFRIVLTHGGDSRTMLLRLVDVFQHLARIERDSGMAPAAPKQPKRVKHIRDSAGRIVESLVHGD